jgi:hypothetical protein
VVGALLAHAEWTWASTAVAAPIAIGKGGDRQDGPHQSMPDDLSSA